jgi:hypothetical protein
VRRSYRDFRKLFIIGRRQDVQVEVQNFESAATSITAAHMHVFWPNILFQVPQHLPFHASTIGRPTQPLLASCASWRLSMLEVFIIGRITVYCHLKYLHHCPVPCLFTCACPAVCLWYSCGTGIHVLGRARSPLCCRRGRLAYTMCCSTATMLLLIKQRQSVPHPVIHYTELMRLPYFLFGA